MIAKIKEIQVKFIECGECSFEASCRLPEVLRRGEFVWNCPNCNQFWTGEINNDGVVSVEKGRKNQSDKHVLIKLPVNLSPLAIIAERVETPEEFTTGRAVKKNYARSETLSLRLCELNNAINVGGFPEYEASLF